MKIKTHYSCQSCGHSTAKWLGKCPGCDAWNSLVEERIAPETAASASHRSSAVEYAAIHAGTGSASLDDWVPLDGPAAEDGELKQVARKSTGISELDRVLGGGLVPDSFVLIGGDPGIGKSTLLLQMAKGVVSANRDLRLLYVSGEESVDQIRGRAKRLDVSGNGRVFLSSETNLERVIATVKDLKPHVIVMDSLQTFSSGALESAPGSVSQVREVAMRLMNLAKTAGISVWLVGHVTKDGNIAGPKAVEHMVDTVLYFEAEAGQSYRLLRTVKNRFGSTRELGVFEMAGDGLREVKNPSSLFLSERKHAVAGTAISASLEGSRPFLVEVQALVAESSLAVPRRTAVGMESSRISLLAAILEKHMKVPLAGHDLFFNVAGGLRLSEPACDLAAATAIWSSYAEKPLPIDLVCIGEVALTGEIRQVLHPEVRAEEAKKLGFKSIALPKGSLERCTEVRGIQFIPISRIEQLPDLFG